MKDNLKDVGILGRRHYDYLKANKPTVINVMRMNGTLNSYLKSVNANAVKMLFQLVIRRKTYG
ncbi:MAG: TnpV protein [Clostridia bacterium]|nr:TnpV protein [Clostridia bacterium]